MHWRGSVLLIDRTQLPLGDIERVANGDVEILMGLLIVLLLINSDFELRRMNFDANGVDLALMVVIVRRIENHTAVDNLVAESF